MESTCSKCKGSAVDVVKDTTREFGYQIIECSECNGTGFKKGTKEYNKVMKSL